MKTENKCEEKIGERRCRNEWQIDHLGKKKCSECWARHCEVTA